MTLRYLGTVYSFHRLYLDAMEWLLVEFITWVARQSNRVIVSDSFNLMKMLFLACNTP